MEEAAEGKHSALAESCRDAERAATTARERISRIEAEHALALRENGKASVRQRALERELARIKSRCQKQNPGFVVFHPDAADVPSMRCNDIARFPLLQGGIPNEVVDVMATSLSGTESGLEHEHVLLIAYTWYSVPGNW